MPKVHRQRHQPMKTGTGTPTIAQPDKTHFPLVVLQLAHRLVLPTVAAVQIRMPFVLPMPI
jgi:hypothetical protein